MNLDYDLGAEVLAYVNGYEGSPDAKEILERFKQLREAGIENKAG